MSTRLRALLKQTPRRLEESDVFGAFLRIARERWGASVPVEPTRFSRGVLTIRCPSPLWRTEVLFSADELREALARDLPHAPIHHITAVLQ